MKFGSIFTIDKGQGKMREATVRDGFSPHGFPKPWFVLRISYRTLGAEKAHFKNERTGIYSLTFDWGNLSTNHLTRQTPMMVFVKSAEPDNFKGSVVT